VGLNLHLGFTKAALSPLSSSGCSPGRIASYKGAIVLGRREKKIVITCEVFAVKFSTLHTAASERSVVYHRLGTGRSLLLSEFTGLFDTVYELIL